MVIVEGFCESKIPVTPTEIEPATFRLVAQCLSQGQAVIQLLETLRYKSEGRGFDSRCCL